MPVLSLVFLWTGCTTSLKPRPAPGANIDPAAAALVEAAATKLQTAGTVQVRARHRIDPALGVGSRLDDGEITVTVARPNRFHAAQPAGPDTRVMVYDGTTLRVIMPELGLHAEARMRTRNLDDFAEDVNARFGFRPALAELLSENLAATLFSDATSARVART